MKLWNKGYDIDKEVEKFTVGDDYLLDQKLVHWDCIASIAHASMLCKIGIFKKKEFTKIKKALVGIIELDKQNKFKIAQEDEDCHTAIENYLVKKLGNLGEKIHTARSRNDQVLAALKLYIKKELLEIIALSLKFCSALLVFSKKNNIPMPGYTHMRKAMPSSAALWGSAFAESMLDNIRMIGNAYELIDSCPLGSAAGYGVPLKIDRQYASVLLGFSKVQSNVMHVQNSRGKNEALVLSCLMNIMLDMSKIASDLILFSMQEFGFFELPEKFCTGSSIMPQKKNPDVFELVRAKSKVVASLHFQVISIIQDLPSGYNRDFQLTKKPLMEGIEITKACLAAMTEVFKNLRVNKKNCKKAMTKELFATDYAYGLVEKGMPFREAYKKAAGEINKIKIPDLADALKKRGHLGGSGNLGLEIIEAALMQLTKQYADKKNEFDSAIRKLLAL